MNTGPGEPWQVVRNGHGLLRTKGTHSMDISEWCHASNRVRALWHALSPSTRLRKRLTWSYGENDSGPWTPVCTLTSVLTNTLQLAQSTPGQPAAYTGWPVKREHVEVGIFQRTRNLWLWHQADYATPTGLPHGGHCLLSPRPDNGLRHRHRLCQALGGHNLTDIRLLVEGQVWRWAKKCSRFPNYTTLYQYNIGSPLLLWTPCQCFKCWLLDTFPKRESVFYIPTWRKSMASQWFAYLRPLAWSRDK